MLHLSRTEGWWVGDIVARHAGSPDFAPQVGLLELLAPCLGAGLKAATLRAQAATEYDNAPVS